MRQARLEYFQNFVENGPTTEQEITRAMYTSPYRINEGDKGEAKLLDIALSSLKFCLAEELLKHGAVSSKGAYKGYTSILHFLVDIGDVKHLEVLENLGSPSVNGEALNAKTKNSRTALYIAASKGHTEFVSALLERGADPNALSNRHCMPLLVSVEKGFVDLTRKLLSASGVDITITDRGFKRQVQHDVQIVVK